MPRKTNKYGAKPTVVDGIRFHSKLESQRYRELLAREKLGLIGNLRRQVTYNVVWPGLSVKDGKLFAYVSDFEYDDANGSHIVEDVKGRVTGPPWASFRVKQRAMRIAHGIEVHVVTRKAVRGTNRWHFDGVPEDKEHVGHEQET